MVPESVLKGLSWGGQHMKRPYETPRLVEYGPIADRTLQTPGRAIKGGAPECSHLDKFVELSALTPDCSSR